MRRPCDAEALCEVWENSSRFGTWRPRMTLGRDSRFTARRGRNPGLVSHTCNVEQIASLGL